MPTNTIRKPPPKKAGGAKGKGIGGISWKWWAVGLVVAVGVGLYLRNKSASTAATAPASAAAPLDTSGGVGGASGSATDPNAAAPGIDTTGLQDAINQLGYVLGGGGGQFAQQPAFDLSAIGGAPVGAAAPLSGTSTASSPVASSSGSKTSASGAKASVPYTVAGSGTKGETINLKTGIASLANGTVVVGPQKSPPAGVNPSNVASVKVLASGATLTTLKSGQQIEQAVGKSPYTVKKAG